MRNTAGVRNKKVILLLVLALSACATGHGFNRDSLHSQMMGDQPVTADEEIRMALAAKPQLRLPFKLAVYFVPAETAFGRYPRSDEQRALTWAGEDKDRLLQMGAELKRKKIISDCIVLDEGIVEGQGNKAIRLAAARAGADAVLVVRGAGDSDRDSNALSVTYLLLLPAFFVPGTTLDALFVANAALWDVRNQYLYLSYESEGKASKTGPAFLLDSGPIIKAAKADALSGLTGAIAGQVASMAGAK